MYAIVSSALRINLKNDTPCVLSMFDYFDSNRNHFKPALMYFVAHKQKLDFGLHHLNDHDWDQSLSIKSATNHFWNTANAIDV